MARWFWSVAVTALGWVSTVVPDRAIVLVESSGTSSTPGELEAFRGDAVSLASIGVSDDRSLFDEGPG